MRLVLAPYVEAGVMQWWQPVQVPEPGDPGYPMVLLPESDPLSPEVNAAITDIAAGPEAGG